MQVPTLRASCRRLVNVHDNSKKRVARGGGPPQGLITATGRRQAADGRRQGTGGRAAGGGGGYARRTGRVSRPWIRELSRQRNVAGSAASDREGNLDNSAPNAISASRHAGGAPRQKWMPWPKATCPPASRLTSSRPASGKRSGSMFADVVTHSTHSRAGIVTPPISTGSRVNRSVAWFSGLT